MNKNPRKLIVLASKSPRRKELLQSLGLKFTVDPSDFEEKDTHLTPGDLVMHNAMGKALDIAKRHKNALVLGVDTVVAYKNHQINKPKDKKDALRILKLLNGSTHKVISGICLTDSDTKDTVTAIETTLIEMDKITEKDMKAYIDSQEGADKAAGYAIQGIGSLFIKRIEGDYFNVVGLPMHTLRKLFNELGYDLLEEFLKK